MVSCLERVGKIKKVSRSCHPDIKNRSFLSKILGIRSQWDDAIDESYDENRSELVPFRAMKRTHAYGTLSKLNLASFLVAKRMH